MIPRLVWACALLACAAGTALAGDTQFHIITGAGNTFVVSPPDLPRPANVVGEAAYLAVRNPPAGMFVASLSNHTMHKFVPLQSGLDTAGFPDGMIRVILESDWSAGTERAFRDQPFGTMAGSPMYHAGTMPLAPAWNATYAHVPLQADSRFGLGAGANNTLGLTADSNGGYKVAMGSRERAGLDFGAGTGLDKTYYIYRGCSSCGALAAVGHGDPADPQETLPNDRATTDHDRGWLGTRGCGVYESDSWSGTGSQTVAEAYSLPPAAHSRAGGHYIDSRYEDLSVLPTGHTPCTGTIYSDDTDDNRKHDMCITGNGTSASTRFTYDYTRTVRVEKIVNGSIVSDKTTSSSGSVWRTTYGSCTPPSTHQTGDGYRVSTVCSGGPSPSNPPSGYSNTVWSGNLQNGRVTTTTVSYSGPGATTYGSVSTSCMLSTNTPHLDLEDAMSIRPGLNLYRPPAIPASHNMLVIYDDAESGGGGNEYIQVYAHPGQAGDPAGPYDFHLKQPGSGILHDAHRHYGWVDSRLYGMDALDSMGYTPHAAMAGHGDGLLRDGSPPYGAGTRLCHGGCLMGPEGIDGAKPSVRLVAPTAARAISGAVSGLVYDHVNNRWFDSAFTGSGDQTVAASLYLVVPFAADTGVRHVHMYDRTFDPERQNAPPRLDPAHPYPCHLGQPGRLYAFASGMDMRAGDSLELPVLPEVRYVAFTGDGNCFWYDVAALPSPLSGVSSGARAVPLANGTILSGDLLARHAGAVHVDVVADFDAVWQSEMYGLSKISSTSNSTWVVPPLHVNVTAVARVNGAPGHCGSPGVYCSDAVEMSGLAHRRGAYIHGTPTVHNTGSPFVHGEPYAERQAGVALTPGSGDEVGFGVYALEGGRCYGLAAVEAGTGGMTVRSIPNIQVRAGDTVTLEFHAAVSPPRTVGGDVGTNLPGRACGILHTEQSAVLDITTMTATLR